MRTAALVGTALLLWPILGRAGEDRRPGPVPSTLAATSSWARHTLASAPDRGKPERLKLREPSWFGPVQFRKKSGLEVTRRVRMGEKDVILGLQGPRNGKRFGMKLEVRF